MPELAHAWGADLQVGPTGDLALVSGTQRGQQRVLRRLLTNPGDYIWQLPYGAGLARFVGQPGGVAAIRAAIRGQIFKEPAVARTPEPAISVSFEPGSVFVQIQYADAATGETQILSFSVNA
jgi:hypothetical protein